jgi:hypothetical protein
LLCGEEWLSGPVAAGLTHAELEEQLGARGRELLRRLHQDHRRRATTFGYTSAERDGADTCADYLTAKKPCLDYAIALRHGWPIATGVIEGACRHLVKDRMDITGARWGTSGAEAILKLRALITNGDFDNYGPFHLRQEHQRVHGVRYRDSLTLAA